MVRGAVVRVDADRAQARHEVGRHEGEVAAVGRLPRVVLVHLERGWVRYGRMQRLPRIDEADVEDLLVLRIVRRKVEIAADDGAGRARLRAERPALIDAPALGEPLEAKLRDPGN